jgi:phosphopantetheinyl transferase
MGVGGVHINRMILYSESAKESTTVYYTSAKFFGDPREVKNTLVRGLLREVHPSFPATKNGQLIIHDEYGCPRLYIENKQPLSISFSYNGQEVWAAVAEMDSLGIDVETLGNFLAPYPYNRAFLEDDFRVVSSFCTGKEDAAALLWSCKEAAVKSRGTGFHFIDPRDVRILSCLQEGYCRYRVTVATPEKICVVAKRERHLWLALSVSG